MQRRGFIGAILAAAAAPAIVKAESLMPIFVPKRFAWAPDAPYPIAYSSAREHVLMMRNESMDYAAFQMLLLRQIAEGLGVPYPSLQKQLSSRANGTVYQPLTSDVRRALLVKQQLSPILTRLADEQDQFTPAIQPRK